MGDDPEHLRHLGELATLKNMIGACYHQDAFLDHKNDAAIWADICAAHHPEALSLLTSQIHTLLARLDDQLINVWNSQAAYHFATPADARRFLSELASFLALSGGDT